MKPGDLADIGGHGYTYLMNGAPPGANWTALFEPNERVRLRFINGSAMSAFDVRIPRTKTTGASRCAGCFAAGGTATGPVRFGGMVTFGGCAGAVANLGALATSGATASVRPNASPLLTRPNTVSASGFHAR